jgi:2,4-dienoyl-CoA reductase (NADPH2)
VSALQLLFSPIQIGSMQLRNRLVMSPMETGYGTRDGLPSPRTLAYFEARPRRRRLITLGACTIDPIHGSADDPAFRQRRRDRCAPRLTERAHEHGARISPSWCIRAPTALPCSPGRRRWAPR